MGAARVGSARDEDSDQGGSLCRLGGRARSAGHFVMPPRSALLMLWRVTRLIFVLLGALITVSPFVASALVAVANGGSPLTMPKIDTIVDFLICGVSTLLLAALLTEANRGRYHALLAKLAFSGQAGKAAGIAALVGKSDPARTLQLARRNFRGVHFSDLVQESFDSSADSHTRSHTLPPRQIDAFLHIHGTTSRGQVAGAASVGARVRGQVSTHAEPVVGQGVH